MWRNYGIGFLLLILLLIVTGCQFTQAAFPRMASNAGSAFAAAVTTLAYAHEGKLTYAYAAASFVNYQSELDGLDQALPSQNGAPDKGTVQHLLNLYKEAIKAVDSPCLNNSCNWQTQVNALNRASKAFLEAGGS
jgi:L-aminopeptidase/D-esterase-like protein